MEIEKKFLVDTVPEDLSSYDVWHIEQYYLCRKPTLRIRRKNEDYILTYKNHIPAAKGDLLSVADETELPLTKEAFDHLCRKSDGRCIQKTRYRIPYGRWTIELDVFHADYEGLCMAEVEFGSIEESRTFEPPSWFGKEVSGDYRYSNSYLAGI